jgi:hypothetical protein
MSHSENVNRNKRRHQHKYSSRVTLDVQDEEYDLSTHTIVQTTKRRRLYNTYYDPPSIDDIRTSTLHRCLRYKYDPRILTHDFSHDPYYSQEYNQPHQLDFRALNEKLQLQGDVPLEYRSFLFRTSTTNPELRILDIAGSFNTIDKLNNPNSCPRRSTVQQIQDRVILNQDYILQRNDYNSCTRPLPLLPFEIPPETPLANGRTFLPFDEGHPTQYLSFIYNDVTYRQHGAVYFSTITTYYPKDTYCPPSLRPRRVKEFIYDTPSQRQRRPHDTRLQHPTFDHITIIGGQSFRRPRQPWSPFYTQSILKIAANERNIYWKNRFNHQRQLRTNTQYREHSRLINFSRDRYTIYRELLKQNNNWQNWFDTTTTIQQDIESDIKEDSREYYYYINREYRHALIDKAAYNHVLYTASIRRIVRNWQFWFRKTKLIRSLSQRTIAKAWGWYKYRQRILKQLFHTITARRIARFCTYWRRRTIILRTASQRTIARTWFHYHNRQLHPINNHN